MSDSESPSVSSLDGSCTVIHDNTLYSFSPDAFLSVSLEEGAEWKKLPDGDREAVTGGVCVGVKLRDPASAALFIVGGQGPDDYSGLQKYDFASKKWTRITPAGQTEIVKNRQGHGAAYNDAANSIVVFGGTRDGSAGASAETYTIAASEPYAGIGRDAGKAAPGKEPLLYGWIGSDIVMVGGAGAAAGKTYLFNDGVGWRPYGSLAQPFATDSAAIKAALIAGSDNSQHLLVFDLSKSPNSVQRIMIGDANGKAVNNAMPASSDAKRTLSMRTSRMKRDLTEQDWPSYDSSSAPTATRTNYALAQGPDGQIAFSGGDDISVAMFNAKDAGWNVLMSEQKALGLTTSSSLSTSSPTPTSTTSSSTLVTSVTTSASSTSSPSSTSSTSVSSTAPAETSAAAAPGKDSDGPSSNAILGITLGTIGGFLVILLLILFLLKRRKNRVNANQGNVLNPDEKDTVAFAKSTQPTASPSHYRGHNPQLSQESYSSVAILMGRMGPQKSGIARKPSRDSVRSSVSSLHKQFKSTISKPIPQPNNNPMLQGQDDKGVAFAPSVAEPRQRNGPMEAQDGTRRSSGWNRYWSGGSALQILGYGSNKRATATSDQSSHYSESANNANPRATQDSATVPPLNFEGRPEVNSVNTGSPIVSQYNSKVPTEGIAGTIERPVSPLSSTSGYSSGVPESINEMWENRNNEKPWGADRAPSSIYQHSKADSTSAPAPASGVSQQPQLAMAAKSSDMSWLNLGEQSRK